MLAPKGDAGDTGGAGGHNMSEEVPGLRQMKTKGNWDLTEKQAIETFYD